MKRIIVGSQNPVKINAALEGFQAIFPEQEYAVEGVAAASGVKHQPMSDAETLQGAMNRMSHASQLDPRADFWVGIEGGLEENGTEMEIFAWVAVKSKSGAIGKSRTGTFVLPEKLSALIRQRKELAEADDMVFGRKNSKSTNGSVGILTADAIDRTEYYKASVILALIPFKNEELYQLETATSTRRVEMGAK